MARDREGLESGVVWAARPMHPHAHLFPGLQYRRQHPLPLGRLRYTEYQAPQAVVFYQDPSLHHNQKGLNSPVTTQQTSPSCTPHAATYKELIPRTSHY